MRIGIYGRVENSNFGGALTYYALFKYLKSLESETKIIPMAYDQQCAPSHRCYNPNSEGAKFAKRYEELAERREYSDFYKYNSDFDVFILGSDVCFADSAARQFQDSFYLNFANNNKKIFSVSPTCQNKNILDTISKERINEIKEYLNKFDKISVRDNFTKDYLSDIGIKSQRLLDPVFLLTREDYLNLANKRQNDEDFDFYYFATTPKEEYLIMPSDKKLVLTARYNENNILFEKAHSSFSIDYTPENWLSSIINCRNFITTSFHGICFALLLHKPFYAILTKQSYKQRDLLDYFGLSGEDHLDMTEKDFEKTDRIIFEERAKLINFIKENIYGQDCFTGTMS